MCWNNFNFAFVISFLLVLQFFGRFHVLSDFDEGKRSCRRKLERHNNRRRRKPTNSKGGIRKESQREIQIEDTNCDGGAGEGIQCWF